MKAKIASKILQNHFLGNRTPVSEKIVGDIHKEAINSGLNPPFTVLAVNWEKFVDDKVKRGSPNKISKQERNELGGILNNIISQTYFIEVPCLDIKQSIEDFGRFIVDFQGGCKGNPAFPGDVPPEVSGAPVDGNFRGILRRVTGEEIDNAMVVLSWHWMGGGNDKYEVIGYIS